MPTSWEGGEGTQISFRHTVRDDRVSTSATNLDLVRHAIQVHVAPALLAPVRQERAPDTGVHGNESRVLLPQVILAQHLTQGAEVVAGILRAGYDLDVVLLGDDVGDVSRAVEDEDEVGGTVEALADEEAEVLARGLGLRVDVDDKRAGAGRSRWGPRRLQGLVTRGRLRRVRRGIGLGRRRGLGRIFELLPNLVVLRLGRRRRVAVLVLVP